MSDTLETRLESWHLLQADLSARQATVLSALDVPRSNREISVHLGWPINRVTPRVLELREKGCVVSDGKKLDDETRRNVVVWRKRK